MRRFTYAWKTSDGVRHTDETRARSKEEVFSELRKQGIRPITVSEIIPKWRKWVKVASFAIGCGIVTGSILFSYRTSVLINEKVAPKDEQILITFSKTAESIFSDYNKSIASIKPNDLNRNTKIHSAIDVCRSRIRLAYRDVKERLSDARLAKEKAEQFYGSVSSKLDELEFAIESEE